MSEIEKAKSEIEKVKSEKEKTKSEKVTLKGLFSKIKIEYLVVIALAIVAIYIVSQAFISDSNTASTNQNVSSYVDNLETKLTSCLKKVKGAGNVEVIISVESGMQTVLATEKETGENGTVETPIVVNGKTVVLKETYPEITGVVIVCEGANNLSVKLNLLSAACVYLNIDEEKIEILAMK